MKIESKRYNILKYFESSKEAHDYLTMLKKLRLINQNATIKGVH